MKKILVFQLGEDFYGLEVANVQEVVQSPAMYYIPRSPANFLGAINFHGNVLPVLDLAAHLGFDGEKRDQRAIVLASHMCSLALAVTSVFKIVLHEEETPLPGLGEEEEGCFRIQIGDKEETVRLLDIKQLLESLDIN